MIYDLPIVELLGQHRGDRQLYMTTQPLMILGWTIPKGFITDLVSATEAQRDFLPLRQMARSAVLHDALMNLTKLSRWSCNAEMYRQMKRDKVPWNIRVIVWLWLSRPWAPRVRWPQPSIEGEVFK